MRKVIKMKATNSFPLEEIVKKLKGNLKNNGI